MTEPTIRHLLNPNKQPSTPPADSPIPSYLPGTAGTRGHHQPASPKPATSGRGDDREMDPAVLQQAAGGAPEVESHVRNATKTFPGETDRAAAALGTGWVTAQAMEKVADGWLNALKRLADEVDYLGDALKRSATNQEWAEATIKQQIGKIRTGTR